MLALLSLLLLLPLLNAQEEQNPNFRLQLVSQAEDGAYDFAYDSGGDNYHIQSRDTSGTVVGKYAYRDPEGKLHEIGYKADQQGFQPEGDVLPSGAQEPEGYGPPPPSSRGDSGLDPANQFLRPELGGLAGVPVDSPPMPRIRKPVPRNGRLRQPGVRVRTTLRKRVGSAPQPVAPLLSTGNFPEPSPDSSLSQPDPSFGASPYSQLPGEPASDSSYSQGQQSAASFQNPPPGSSPELSSYSQSLAQPGSPPSPGPTSYSLPPSSAAPPPSGSPNQQAFPQYSQPLAHSGTPLQPPTVTLSVQQPTPLVNTVSLFRSLASMVSPDVRSSGTSVSFGPIPGHLVFPPGPSLQPFAHPMTYPLPQYTASPFGVTGSEIPQSLGESPLATPNAQQPTTYSAEPIQPSFPADRLELVRALIRLVLEFVASDPILRAQLREAVHESNGNGNNNGVMPPPLPCQGPNCQPMQPPQQAPPGGAYPPSSPDSFPPCPPNAPCPPPQPPSVGPPQAPQNPDPSMQPGSFPPPQSFSQPPSQPGSLPPPQSASQYSQPPSQPGAFTPPQSFSQYSAAPPQPSAFPPPQALSQYSAAPSPPSQPSQQATFPPCPPGGCPTMLLPSQGPVTQCPPNGPCPPMQPPSQGSFSDQQPPSQDPFSQCPPNGVCPPMQPPSKGPFSPNQQPPFQGPFSPDQQPPSQGPFSPDRQPPSQGSFSLDQQLPSQGPFSPDHQPPSQGPFSPDQQLPSQGPFSPDRQPPPQGPFPPNGQPPSQGPFPPNGQPPSQGPFSPNGQPPSQGPFSPDQQSSSPDPYPPCQPGGPCPPASADPSSQMMELDSFFSAGAALSSRPDPSSPLFTPVEGVRDVEGTQVLERDYLPLTRRYGYFLTQEKSDQ